MPFSSKPGKGEGENHAPVPPGHDAHSCFVPSRERQGSGNPLPSRNARQRAVKRAGGAGGARAASPPRARSRRTSAGCLNSDLKGWTRPLEKQPCPPGTPLDRHSWGRLCSSGVTRTTSAWSVQSPPGRCPSLLQGAALSRVQQHSSQPAHLPVKTHNRKSHDPTKGWY